MRKPSFLPPSFPHPLPQVGAILNLDTELRHHTACDDLYLGNKHWQLDGSCVLVAPDRILTIRHILEKRSRSAVFMPYEGIFPLHQKLDREPQVNGDNLALVRLERPVEHTAPPSYKKIAFRHKEDATVLTCGYGRWPGTSLDNLEGLQQHNRVELGPPPARSRIFWDGRCDNLDLCWSSAENAGIRAGRGNSGGPMLLWADEAYSIIGINREEKPDQQIGSWIGRDRKKWLDDELKQLTEFPSVNAVRSRFSYPVVIEAGGGVLLRISVPQGAAQVRATLNASDGLRLQMKVQSAAASGDLLEKIQEDSQANGRFLSRQLTLDGETTLAIGIAPVARAPVRAERVLAQLCVLFF